MRRWTKIVQYILRKKTSQWHLIHTYVYMYILRSYIYIIYYGHIYIFIILQRPQFDLTLNDARYSNKVNVAESSRNHHHISTIKCPHCKAIPTILLPVLRQCGVVVPLDEVGAFLNVVDDSRWLKPAPSCLYRSVLQYRTLLCFYCYPYILHSTTDTCTCIMDPSSVAYIIYIYVDTVYIYIYIQVQSLHSPTTKKTPPVSPLAQATLIDVEDFMMNRANSGWRGRG